jgi:hypothetical protein
MAAPWLEFAERYPGEPVLLFVRYDWLPPGFAIANACSAYGEQTLSEALASLRGDLWDWMRDPATGEPVSRTPQPWPAAEPAAVAAEPAPAPQPVAAEPARPRPLLPGEAQPPAAPAPHGAAAPTLPSLRADAAAGRPVSLAALAAAITAERPAPTGEGLAGQSWDPGTPAARAAAALQGERVGILWPISQALRGEGVALPPTWEHGGPVLDGTVPLARALAALPLGAIATAAAALAALPPVTAAQDAALSACRTGAVPGRPYL